MRGGVLALLVPLLGVACAYDWTVVPGETGTCATNDDCTSSRYCVYSDGQCGLGAAGVCKARPSKSSCAGEEPVCSCDKLLGAGQCVLGANGIDVATDGRCQ